MSIFNNFGSVRADVVRRAAERYGTPIYLYDERFITDRCRALLAMPSAYGLTVRYAMKANSNKTILKIIDRQGLGFDASSLSEVKRAYMAGVDYAKIILTTQEVPSAGERGELEQMMKRGLKYNACSLRQLALIGDFAARENIALATRIHPGVGSGETATRNTGDKYSCFGVHLTDVGQAVAFAREKGFAFDHVHVHIGSGADTAVWRDNIDAELNILERYFPDASTVSFGGGLKEARMPGETPADIHALGDYARGRVERFYEKTGRKLHMEIEPGTFVMANAGYAVTEVIDKKRTGDDGMTFIIANGGMEINARPLMYASRHPFYVVSRDGRLLSSEFDGSWGGQGFEAAVVGRCCESGDSQTLDECGVNRPRKMAEPGIGDYVVIGGAGAYCSSMSPMNYNSHPQAPEVLYTLGGELVEIRKRQTLEQIVANEA